MNSIDTNNSEIHEEQIGGGKLRNYSEQEPSQIPENNGVETENSSKDIGSFSLRLKQRRKELGLSQKEAAERVRVSISAYVRYEHGYFRMRKS